MARERLYRAIYEPEWGDGESDFEFYSEHRAKSKANLEDAISYYRRHYGWARIKIVQIYLV